MRAAVAILLTAACAIPGVLAPRVEAQQDLPDIRVLHVRGPIYLIAAGGANITASIGPDGVLLVDTGPAEMADRVVAAVRELQTQLSSLAVTVPVGGADTRSAAQLLRAPPRPPKPIQYIFNTQSHADHTGGNSKLAVTPRLISFESPESAGEDVTRVFAHENTYLRMSRQKEGGASLPYEMLPTDTYFTDTYKLSSHFNGEGVVALHQARAHTDGDTLVWFRGSDVIAAGDIYLTTAYPTPDVERGGSIQGVIEGLNRLLDLAVPESRAEGGTFIVPGHGRLSDFGDVAHYRDVVTIIRDRVQHLIAKSMTLDQVKAARVSEEYDGRYGRETGSADRFIEAIYQSLARK